MSKTDLLRDLPDVVRRRARSSGAVGEAWLRDLPALVAHLLDAWKLTWRATLDGGSESFVADVSLPSGERAVLKVPITDTDPDRAEARVLRAADGIGYARLLEYDAAHDALLLERLGPRLSDLGLPIHEQIARVCTTLARAWRAPADPSFTTGAQKARDLIAYIDTTWRAVGRPCSERVIDVARAFAELRERAFDPARAVLAHGDAHANNTLRVPGIEPMQFKFVDPDGLFIEPAYDLAILMRDWGAQLLAGDTLALGLARCAQLARLTGVEPQAIWQWGFIERVSTGLALKTLAVDDEAAEFLAVAEVFARAGTGPIDPPHP